MGPPNERDPFHSPHARRPLLCRLGWHLWQRLPLLPGMAKRMCIGRRGCPRCGLIQMRKPYGWVKWGYVLPADIGMDLNAMVDKYVVNRTAEPSA